MRDNSSKAVVDGARGIVHLTAIRVKVLVTVRVKVLVRVTVSDTVSVGCNEQFP